jgi:hypothetical protein
MAEKDQDPPAAPALRADAVLSGRAGRLAAKWAVLADVFEAATDKKDFDPRDADKALRTLALLGRAAVSLHQMQAAEDKAADRVLDRVARRAHAAVYARNPINPDEGDETEMHEPDPRLGDPKAMAEVDQTICDRLDEIALEIKAEGLSRRPARSAAHSSVRQLVPPEPPGAAPAH